MSSSDTMACEAVGSSSSNGSPSEGMSEPGASSSSSSMEASSGAMPTRVGISSTSSGASSTYTGCLRVFGAASWSRARVGARTIVGGGSSSSPSDSAAIDDDVASSSESPSDMPSSLAYDASRSADSTRGSSSEEARPGSSVSISPSSSPETSVSSAESEARSSGAGVSKTSCSPEVMASPTSASSLTTVASPSSSMTSSESLEGSVASASSSPGGCSSASSGGGATSTSSSLESTRMASSPTDSTTVADGAAATGPSTRSTDRHAGTSGWEGFCWRMVARYGRASAQPQHVQELLGRLRRVPGRDVDLIRLLVRIQVLRVHGEDLAQVLQRFVVEPVLHVDVGLREQLGELLAGKASRLLHGRRRGRHGLRRLCRLRRGGSRRGGTAREQIRVLRIQHFNLRPDGLGLVLPAALLVDLRQLLVDGHRLGGLPQALEGLRQERQRLHIAAIRLEAHLQLRERALLVTALQIRSRQLLGERQVVRLERGQSLGHAGPVVAAAVALEVFGGALELLDGFARHVLAGVELREFDLRRHVLGVEIHHLLQGIERRLGVARLVVVVGDNLEVRHRLRHQPELLVKLRQLEVHLQQVRVELEDLLVEGDGLEEEPVGGVALGDFREEVRRLGVVVLLDVQLAHLLEDPDVLRINLQDLLVLLDGFVVRALRDQLRGGFDDLVLVHRAWASGKPKPLGTSRVSIFKRGRVGG